MDQLEEIKRKIDIVDFINSYTPLKKAGRNFKAVCPFHQEKTPSFVVSAERQIWHCFGACNEGGDAFTFLMKIENLTFGEAVKELAKRAGVKLTQFQPTSAEKQKQTLYEINHLASEFYHYLLLNHPAGKKALDYILGRGISKASIELFKIGFAPNAWESLGKYLIGKKRYSPKSLEDLGLIIKKSNGSFYDRFRNRLMFPLKDHRGNVCGFAGRSLDPQAKEAKYVNTPETPIYHKSDLLYGFFEAKDEIKTKDQVILVEGELDMISSYQAGVKNTVAIKGSALTENQTKLIGRFTRNLVLSLDQDVAGDQAARRGIEIADAQEMNVRLVEIKDGKDPDEIAQKDPKAWQKLVEEAIPVYDYLLNSAFSRFDSQTIEGKRKIGQELVPILAKINNDIILSHYVKMLAERLDVSQEAIIEEVEKIKGQQNQEKEGFFTSPNTEGKKPRREMTEEYLLALAFQSDNWQILRKKTTSQLIKTYRLKRILETLKEYFKKFDKKINSEKLAKMLDPELVVTFNRFYLIDLTELIEDEEKLEHEFTKTIGRLGQLDLVEKLKAISDKIKNLEKQPKLSASQQKELNVFNEEFRDLSSKMALLQKEN